MLAWIYLSLAIAFEVTGTILLKYSNGFEKVGLGMASIACYSICFWLLAPAIKVIPVGVAYAIWAGFGIMTVSILSVFLFGQKLAIPQYGFIGLILVGAVGLNLTTQH
jgi:multidrug transporter EmrE-like cation transporter